jgi:fluoroquinolone resistance protein
VPELGAAGDVPAAGDEVREEDWDGRSIDGLTYSGVSFIDVDMTELRSHGCAFTDCHFRQVRFNASRHVDSAFVNCTFTQCGFFDSRFENCKMIGSTFTRCTFSTLTADGGDWSFVGLAGEDIRSASFTRLRMREADLTGVRAGGATLRDLDLAGATFHGADLSRADLRGSDLTDLDPAAVELRGATIGWQQAVQLASALGLEVILE